MARAQHVAVPCVVSPAIWVDADGLLHRAKIMRGEL